MESKRTATTYFIPPGKFLLMENALGNPDLIQSSVSSDCRVTIVDLENFPLDDLEQWPTFRLISSDIKLKLGEGKYHIYIVVPAADNTESTSAFVSYNTRLVDRKGYAQDGTFLGKAGFRYYPCGTVSERGGNPSAATTPSGQGRVVEMDLGVTPTVTNLPGNFSDLEEVFHIEKSDPSNPSSWLMTIVGTVKSMTARIIRVTSSLIFGSGENERRLVGVAVRKDATTPGMVSDTIIATTAWVDAQFEHLDDRYLSKQKDDSTPFNLGVGKNLSVGGTLSVRSDAVISGKTTSKDKITAEKGIQIGESFVPGILTGSGGFFDEHANGEVESLIIRRFLEVPELRYNRVQVTLGDKWNAAGAGVIERVSPDSDITGTAWLKLEEGEFGAIAIGDICMGIFHSMNNSDNASKDEEVYVKNDKGETVLAGFQFSGFYTCYFTITEITGSDNKEFRYELRQEKGKWEHKFHPSSSMHFVCYGSFSNPSRQTSVYTTRTYTRLLKNQNTWEIGSVNIAMQYGDLSNMSLHGLDMRGYSAYLNNIYMTGTIAQIKADGTPVLVANDRGDWVSGTVYDYYDRVSHNGSLWLCVNESGTNTEPSKGNSDWLLQVASGDSLIIGGRFSSSKTPYSPNSIIDFAGKVWATTDTVDYAPYGIWTDASGNRFQFNDGGFCLVDDSEIQTGWTLFVDIEDVKDGEDGKSLIVQYSADGSSWHDTFVQGDVYMRQKLGDDGVWSDKIRIAGEAGAAGADGKYTDYQFAVNGSLTEAPTSGWSDTPPFVDKGQYLWMRKRVVDPNNNTATPWEVVRIGGEKGDSSFKSTVFIRTNEEPKTPTGGDYYNPKPTSTPQWEDGIPSGEAILWSSTRTFSISGAAPQTESWSKPVKMTDTADFDVDWSSVENNVGNPTTKPENWTNVSSEDTIWMATRTKKNGVWSEWQVSKIKGEKGDSLEMLGNYSSSVKVTKLGVVYMGGSSWIAKVDTVNPPLWCWTDSSGNRFKFSNGGFALTGEENTSEYELMVQSGKDGKDGTDYEFVFFNSKTETRPATPSTGQADDYVPSGWHDNAVGVSESIPYEWMSQRKKKDGIWSAFSTPSLWAKYGEDGTNWEFVYKRTAENKAPSAPDSVQQDDYIPSGWTDDPVGVDTSYQWEWMSKRRKVGSKWEDYSTPALWANYGDSSFKSTVFLRQNSTPDVPTGGSYDKPKPTSSPAWSDGIPSGEQVLWASTRIFTKSGKGIQETAWSTPRAMTDTASFEAIYHDSLYEPTPPTNYPSTTGAWTPDNGWKDDPSESSVWMATATKTNGVWGAWKVSKIKGEKGEDGTDGLVYKIEPNIQTISKTADGKLNPERVTFKLQENSGGKIGYYPSHWTLRGKRSQSDSWTQIAAQNGVESFEAVFSDAYKYYELTGRTYGNMSSDLLGDTISISVVADGVNGKDGSQGIQGCIIRKSEFKAGVQYRNDEALTEGTRYVDVVLIRNSSMATGWIAYKCKKTTTLIVPTAPTSSPAWSDGIPDGGATLWMSTCVFTQGGTSTPIWSEPIKVTDTSSVELVFHSSETTPSAPTNYPNTTGSWTPSNGWTDEPSSSSVWMAKSVKTSGAWGAWQITKIKGEGSGSTFTSTVFIRQNRTPSTPTGGSYDNPIPTSSPWLPENGWELTPISKTLWKAVSKRINGTWSAWAVSEYKAGYDVQSSADVKVVYRSPDVFEPGYADNTDYWEVFGINTTSIFTDLIVAKDASINFVQGNELLIKGSDGVTVEAGLSGSSATGGDVRMWVGGEIPGKAPFTVDKKGVATATKFRTGRSGLRIEAENGIISIFGNFAKNIEFGINDEGMAVLRYYNNEGRLLYDLGPDGIKNVGRGEEDWRMVRLTYLGLTEANVFSSYWSYVKNPVYKTGEDRYQYISAYIGNAIEDAFNNRRYFKSKTKSEANVIGDGWYTYTLGEGQDRLMWDGLEGELPSDMSSNNPTVDFYRPIYITKVMLIQSGLVVGSVNAYYNL